MLPGHARMQIAEHERFMRLALCEALRSGSRGDVPVGAVVVASGQVLARAGNEKEWRQDPTAHAEMLALREAAAKLHTWRLTEVTVYSTMEPCFMCAGALLQARVARVVYAVDDPKWGAAGSVLDLLRAPFVNHRVEVVRGVLAEEVAVALAEFFGKLRSAE